jgi:hypothetical protein
MLSEDQLLAACPLCKPDAEDHGMAAVARVAGRYNVRLLQLPRGPSTRGPYEVSMPSISWLRKHVPDASLGPALGPSGFSVQLRAVFVSPASPVETVLHELVHLVMGRRSEDVCEAFALIPFERRLAAWAAQRMPPPQRGWFMRQVDSYQSVTDVAVSRNKMGDVYYTTAVDFTSRRHVWWQASLRRAQRMGLLDERLQPTFRDADWGAVGAEAEGWCIRDDYRKRVA